MSGIVVAKALATPLNIRAINPRWLHEFHTVGI